MRRPGPYASPRRRTGSGPGPWRAAVIGSLLALIAACRSAPDPGADRVLLAYVANAGTNNVQVIDAATGETLRKIYAGTTPWRLLPAPDGRSLWVQHWSSETTAVIDLEDHQVRTALPVRGPGIFAPDGGRFLSFSWPRPALTLYSALGLGAGAAQPLETRPTGVSRVYDLAFADGGDDLFLARYDPIAPEQSERYAYVVSWPWSHERPVPRSVATGLSPIDVLAVPGQPFLLTADRGGERLTLLNVHGDGRAVAACPGPRRLLLTEDATRLVVLCWDRAAGRHGHAVSYRTDFDLRPWPRFTEEAAVTLDAGPVAGAFAPAGERIWIVDQPGRRLLELDAADLRVRRVVAVGEVPSDVALIAVPRPWRRRLSSTGDSRRRLLTALAGWRDASAAFRSLRWTETVTWSEPPVPASAADGYPRPTEAHSRRIETALAAPARVRRQALDDTISLAAGGWSMTVRRDGRFWTTPRQELVSLLYALPNFEPGAAVRRLAGDVPGSPYLSGGLAVDLIAEVEEDGRRHLVIGALEPDRPVAQLWIDAETGRPAKLIEKFPAGATAGHDDPAIGRFVETRFHDFTTLDGGVLLPARLERVLDGRWRQEVSLDDVEVDLDLVATDFDLARLGNFAEPPTSLAAGAAGAAGGPGRAVPILEHGYLENPWEDHPGYNSSPPTSGPRLRSLAEWGVHPLPVPLALQVHNLEHGGVAVQYRCKPQDPAETCRHLAAELARVTAPYERILVAPYPFMDDLVALTAWGRIETLNTVDEDRIVAFIEAWEGRDHHRSGHPP